MTIKRLFIATILLLSVNMETYTKVRLVLSAALTDYYYEFRKQQYVAMFDNLTKLGYKDPYVIEAIKKRGPTFIDRYTKNTFYSSVNNDTLRNKGINEATTMLEGLKYFNFDPEDMVLKITGRYECIGDTFLKFVERNQQADAIVKFTADGQVLTLCYAMKQKHFIHMFEALNYRKMEAETIYLEQAVGEYIRYRMKQGNFKVIVVDKLHVRSNYLGSNCIPGNPTEVVNH